jgi:hypothetical protein
MPVNLRYEEKYLIERAVSWLQLNLPETWKAAATSQTVPSQSPSRPSSTIDAIITITPPHQGGGANLLVEAKTNFVPRDAERLFTGMAQQLRLLNSNYPILVVAPWLSERAQAVLTKEDINYLDLTGNVRIALNYPPLFVTHKGAVRNPAPSERAPARLKGPKAGRLARFLVDVAPPYGVLQIAEATGLTQGYTSRLLTSLDEDALIERAPRGQVQSVDISEILLRWTQTYDLFKSNQTISYVAPKGTEDILKRLSSLPPSSPLVAVTGSFSAIRYAPVAAPSLLVLYCEEPTILAREFGLLPSDRGSNVVLLRPFDQVVWERTTKASGVTYVAVAQTAADCLTGNGRMPAEGDALSSWMEANESRWRLSSISELPDDAKSAT